jgi:hypothetical protein
MEVRLLFILQFKWLPDIQALGNVTGAGSTIDRHSIPKKRNGQPSIKVSSLKSVERSDNREDSPTVKPTPAHDHRLYASLAS